ncbi:ATP-dependent nuclease [Bacteroides hominis]|uniref:ATP-dependent nuclease n=1 Tax=Bacteroides hominis TaxID=2763023 RepID=UPI003D6B0B6E
MIKKITIENYRGYSYHEIIFRDLNIVVGKNNAGKTTLIEALRLVSLVSKRYKTSPIKNVPDWLNIPKSYIGVSPSMQRIDYSYSNVFYSYNDPPAIITADFENNTSIKIYFAGEQKFHAVLFTNGEVCKKGDIKKIELPVINILPQITPLLQEEKVLQEDYVKLNIDSSTSSRHFRNQLGYFSSEYDKFKELAESTWAGIRLLEYSKGNRITDTNPYLLIQEGAFSTEIGHMGHGLQMWLQTIWFLARCQPTSTVILDEPDVYMHADLQRKLIRFLRNDYQQVIVATHSIEIMSEVEAENILIIDKKKKYSIFASDFNAVQKTLLNLGSIHNIALARLWSANKLLIVEGKDIDILKRLQNTLFRNSNEPFDAIPHMSIGGWGGWGRAVGSKLMLKNAGEESINVYCILDSDYHTKDEIDTRYLEASKNCICLKIWKKKEIENYLINPETIKRLIYKGTGKDVNIHLIEEKIDSIIENLKTDYLDLLMDNIHKESRLSGKTIEPSTARKKALVQLEEAWKDKYSIISGKNIIKQINNWVNLEYKISINSNKIAQEMNFDEIPKELKNVITKIENNEKW